jgi:RND family efflux transporter MFP subunit
MKSNFKGLLFLGALLACCSAGAAPAQRPPESVRVEPVQSVVRNLSRKYIGKITAVNDVNVVARISGVIQDQQFASGDVVKKGQMLFVIEDTTYVAAKKSAEARLLQSRAEHAYAVRNLERQKTLKQNKATSESSYDEAVRLEATSRAAVAAAEAALLDAENNLSYTKIVAPISGKVDKASYSPGNYVTPASGKLLNIVSMDDMYVNLWMSMNDYLMMFGGSFETLKNEAVCKIFLADGSEFKGAGKIVFIDNRVDKDTDTIRILIQVKNDDMLLLPDSLVTVRVSRKDGEKTAIPVSAIMNNGKISYVYILDEKNIPQVRLVELGEIQGNQQIVLKGLKKGETVVVDGTHKAIPGRPVNPVPVNAEMK